MRDTGSLLKRWKKMSDNNSGGVGFVGLLQIVFIILKLTEVIEWSWFWVLSPLWISAILFSIVAVILFIIYLGE
jgi:hypothetical protein